MAACPAGDAGLATLLERLRGLYRGDFLTREDDHPWRLGQRERRRRRWTALLPLLAQSCTNRQQASEAVRRGREATAVDPLPEAATAG